jgi:hypothetical protein
MRSASGLGAEKLNMFPTARCRVGRLHPELAYDNKANCPPAKVVNSFQLTRWPYVQAKSRSQA